MSAYASEAIAHYHEVGAIGQSQAEALALACREAEGPRGEQEADVVVRGQRRIEARLGIRIRELLVEPLRPIGLVRVEYDAVHFLIRMHDLGGMLDV